MNHAQPFPFAHRNPFGRTLWPVVTSLCSALVMTAALAAPAPTTDVARAQSSTDHAQRYARALEDVRGRRFASAYGALAQLADEGHAAAASMALAMVRHGSLAFGSDFSATAGQLRRWNILAERDLIEHSFEITNHERGE